mmetsp:Transcript_11278/g.22198  ORF Transcript_11278/g.22198 Transcript_11278/m.22198 type:complete len:322 (+) Transcript_11278:544-1509(+)
MHSSLKLSSSSLGSKLGESFGYSAQFVNDIERQHKEALIGVGDKKASMERNHSRITESLKKQLDALKQQSDFNATAQLRESNALREEFEIRIQAMSREQDAIERNLREQLTQVQNGTEDARMRNSRLKQEELEERLKNEEEISCLHGRVRSLHQEKERLRIDVIDSGRLEIERLEQYQEELKEKHTEAMRYMREGFTESMQDFREKIEEKHRQIKRTEQELNDSRRELILKSESTERELQLMQSSLREVRQIMETQEAELQRLKSQHDEAVKEGMIFKKEAALLTNEVGRVRRDNKELTEEVKRLEKLVYGKGKSLPSPSK